MTEDELKARFKSWALAILKFTAHLPKTSEYRAVRNQIIRSATSSAANYRAACRGKSNADFINKLKIVEEELDESLFWLEIIVGLDDTWRPPITPLYKEGNELLSITVASIKTLRKKS